MLDPSFLAPTILISHIQIRPGWRTLTPYCHPSKAEPPKSDTFSNNLPNTKVLLSLTETPESEELWLSVGLHVIVRRGVLRHQDDGNKSFLKPCLKCNSRQCFGGNASESGWGNRAAATLGEWHLSCSPSGPFAVDLATSQSTYAQLQCRTPRPGDFGSRPRYNPASTLGLEHRTLSDT